MFSFFIFNKAFPGTVDAIERHLQTAYITKGWKTLYFLNKLKKIKFSNFEIFVNFYRKILSWPETSKACLVRAQPRTERLEHHWYPSREHYWYRWSEMSAQTPKDTTSQHPPQPQFVHPAAMWRTIQKDLLPYHQTAESAERASFLRLWDS